MRKKMPCVLLLTMVLSAAGSLSGATTVSATDVTGNVEKNVTDSNLLSKVDNADVTPENLGIPGEARYGTKYYARNIWDMIAVDGKVLLSMGDYGTNAGAVPIYYYKNDSTTKYECTYKSSQTTAGLSSEEIKRFFEIDGEIYATATDPLNWSVGSYYKYDSATNQWTDYAKMPLCVHCYDMIEYDGEVFFAGMVRNSNNKIVSCVQKLNKEELDSDKNVSTVDFYDINGNKMELKQVTYNYSNGTSSTEWVSHYWRTYDIFEYKGELYVAHSTSANYTKNEYSGLYKYDKENNRFNQISTGEDIKGFMSVTRNITNSAYKHVDNQAIEIPIHYSFEDNSRIDSALTIGQEEIFSEPTCGAKISTDDTFVAVCNGIFKSSDVITFEKVSLGEGYENYVTRDAFEKDGKYYFLASQKNGTDDFTTAVFETDGNFTKFRKVLSFATKSFARSFVYNEGYLYVGLGGNGRIDNIGDSSGSAYSGTVYRINLADWVSADESETGKDENEGGMEDGKTTEDETVVGGEEDDKTTEDETVTGGEENQGGTEDGKTTEDETVTGGEENQGGTEDGKTTEDETVTGGEENQGGTEAGKNIEEAGKPEYNVGDTIDEENAQYKVTTAGETDGTVEYIGIKNSKEKTITIPSTILIGKNTYKVTSVADNVFKNNKYVTKVVIGDNVKSIGKNAFSGCKKLKTVRIGKNTTTISSKAFYNCTSLTKVTIPSKVTRIGSYTFKNCKKLSSVTIGSGVEAIGKEAFKDCSKLKKITIKSKKLKSVGKNTFKGIKANAKIKVPSSKVKVYKKLLKNKGQSKKVKITK